MRKAFEKKYTGSLARPIIIDHVGDMPLMFYKNKALGNQYVDNYCDKLKIQNKERQLKELSSKLHNDLFDYYEIPKDDSKESWKQLAIVLALRHVPGLKSRDIFDKVTTARKEKVMLNLYFDVYFFREWLVKKENNNRLSDRRVLDEFYKAHLDKKPDNIYRIKNRDTLKKEFSKAKNNRKVQSMFGFYFLHLHQKLLPWYDVLHHK